jgi:hypothetical protein
MCAAWADPNQLEARLCTGKLGATSNYQIHSSGMSLFIRFVSDGSTQGRGFKLSYWATTVKPDSNTRKWDIILDIYMVFFSSFIFLY